jgi:hypothetical protein
VQVGRQTAYVLYRDPLALVNRVWDHRLTLKPLWIVGELGVLDP